MFGVMQPNKYIEVKNRDRGSQAAAAKSQHSSFTQIGLTKRETAAIEAMKSIIASGIWTMEDINAVAVTAVQLADALFAELDKEEGKEKGALEP